MLHTHIPKEWSGHLPCPIFAIQNIQGHRYIPNILHRSLSGFHGIVYGGRRQRYVVYARWWRRSQQLTIRWGQRSLLHCRCATLNCQKNEWSCIGAPPNQIISKIPSGLLYYLYTYPVMCRQTIAYRCPDLSANQSRTKPPSDPCTYNTLTVAHCICRYSLCCKRFSALTVVRYVSVNLYRYSVVSLPIVDRVRIDIGRYPFRPYFNLSLRHGCVMHKYTIRTHTYTHKN